MHKDPGKSPKAPKKTQPPSSRTGVRAANGDSKSWFKPKPVKGKNIKDIEIKPISASTPALNNNNESKKSNKRPLTFVEGNVTLRRGQQPSKIDASSPDDLSRSSSVTNLNAEAKPKGAKPKKAESKERLDRVDRKNDKRTLSKNNNKEATEAPDLDVAALQKQLEQMANEKTSLALQLGEQNGQILRLQDEVRQLKTLQEEAEQKVDQLADENSVLRKQLRDVANSPLSDNEKQQILYEHRHSSAPASIATNLLDDGGDITACPTPEWDKHSSSNVSEVSVACLQDKINQMQETHYSTNEELQATLQELTDLQRQLTELQQENLRLSDEKNLMFESLCRQTERLNDSRSEVESLKQLLYKDESGQFETAAEREQKLVDLLKSAQEEREALLLKQEQLGNDLEDARAANLVQNDEIAQLTERVKTLESTLDAKHAEHKQLDQELALAKDQSSSRQIEINRLKDLLENARTKITELEQDRALIDKSELDELLDNTRKEKDALESEVAHLKEQLALSKNETEKLKEQVSILQEECKVTRNNAKSTQSDLEYKLEKLQGEKIALNEQLQQFQAAVDELQVQAQCQSEDKRQLSAVLSETQRNLNESERKILELENELTELKRVKQEQEEEWEKFQKDLLTSVRVANDFKTEAQQDLQKLIMENKAGRDRIKQLEVQIEKLKGPSTIQDKRASLNRRYKEIEDLADDQLTQEQQAVKLLKDHYDRDLPRRKPVARKPKDKLAISKPSLESVIADPKLGKIVNDTRLRNVEHGFLEEEAQKPPDEVQKPPNVVQKHYYDFGLPKVGERSKDAQSEAWGPTKTSPEVFNRSKSLMDLPNSEPQLRRYDSTENLLSLTKERVKKPRKKSIVTYDTLEKICREIEPNTPEDQLTKEQRLALRLRDVLGKEPVKTPVKKHPKVGRKKIAISRPTQESVTRNEKLRLIIEDPVMKNVGPESRVVKRSKRVKKDKDRYSMPVTSPKPHGSLKITKSMSYNDITFKFEVPNMYSSEDIDVAVPPPAEFRDPVPCTEDLAFKTFRADNNTFKREHNYLDDSLKKQKRYIEELDFVDGAGSPPVAETINEVVTEINSVKDPDDERKNVKPVAEDSDDERKSEDQDEDLEEKSNDYNDDETLNGITRRIFEDDLSDNDLSEEEAKVRRGTRQRFSHVIEEMKGKFDKSGDEEEILRAVPVVTVNDGNNEVLDDKTPPGNLFDLLRTERLTSKVDIEEMEEEYRKSFEYEEITELLTTSEEDEETERTIATYVADDFTGTVVINTFEDVDGVNTTIVVEEAPTKELNVGVIIEEIDEKEEIKLEPSEVFIEETQNFIFNERAFTEKYDSEINEESDSSEDLVVVHKNSEDGRVETGNLGEERISEALNEDIKILVKDIGKENVMEDTKEGEEIENTTFSKVLIPKDTELIYQVTRRRPPRSLSDVTSEDLASIESINKYDEVKFSISNDLTNEETSHTLENEKFNQKEESETKDTQSQIDLTFEEMDLINQSKHRTSRNVSDIKPEDLALVDALKERYDTEDFKNEDSVKKIDAEEKEEVEKLRDKNRERCDKNEDIEGSILVDTDEKEQIDKKLERYDTEDFKSEDAEGPISIDAEEKEEIVKLRGKKLKRYYSEDLKNEGVEGPISIDAEKKFRDKKQERYDKNEDTEESVPIDADERQQMEMLRDEKLKRYDVEDSKNEDLEELIPMNTDEKDEIEKLRDKKLERYDTESFKNKDTEGSVPIDTEEKEEIEKLRDKNRERYNKNEGTEDSILVDTDEKEQIEMLRDKKLDRYDTKDFKNDDAEGPISIDAEEKSRDKKRERYDGNEDTDESIPIDADENQQMEMLRDEKLERHDTEDFKNEDTEVTVPVDAEEKETEKLGDKKLELSEEIGFYEQYNTGIFENEELEEPKLNDTQKEEKPGYSEDLTPEEIELIHQFTKPRTSRPLSNLKPEEYESEDPQKEEKAERRKPPPPRILSPTKLNEKPSYEPVYANVYAASAPNRNSPNVPTSISGKKPVAAPRITSLETNESIYHEFGGQARKTRFSITYDRKKRDPFKEKHQEKSAKVSDLKKMFENKSKDFSASVTKVLESQD